jgi:transposase
MCPYRPINKHLPTIRKIPDDLWDEIKLLLPTIGRPVIPFRKVLDGIVYILRTGCQWKMLPKEYGSGSTCHRRFQEWTVSKVFQKLWVRLLKVYDDLRGIRWTWSQMRPSFAIYTPYELYIVHDFI